MTTNSPFNLTFDDLYPILKMSACVDVIRFLRPETSEHCLFVTNLPSDISREETWAKLHEAFSQFGLVHKVQFPDGEQVNYGFVKFFSAYSTRSARLALDKRLVIGDNVIKVFVSRERPSCNDPLYISDCHQLANHYLGFNGWNTQVVSMEMVSRNEFSCKAVIRVKGWEVESVGRGRVTLEMENDVCSQLKAVGVAKKQVWSRACEDGFSRVVLAVIQPGDRLASVTVIRKETDTHYELPTINMLPEDAYHEDNQTIQ